MRDRWAAACAGQGQLVLLSGEAGIGKSRIAQGLIEAIPDAHVRIVWQCSPYHAETTLHPAIQQIARAAGFAPGEDEMGRRARLDALLARDGGGRRGGGSAHRADGPRAVASHGSGAGARAARWTR